VTENIQQFLHYNKEELLGKSVYNIIHHGDHTKFGVLLNNPLLIYDSPIGSLGSNVPTTPLMEQSPSGSKGNNWNQRFTKKFNCRLLIKPPSDQDQTIEEKQTRVSQYETLQVIIIHYNSFYITLKPFILTVFKLLRYRQQKLMVVWSMTKIVQMALARICYA